MALVVRWASGLARAAGWMALWVKAKARERERELGLAMKVHPVRGQETAPVRVRVKPGRPVPWGSRRRALPGC